MRKTTSVAALRRGPLWIALAAVMLLAVVIATAFALGGRGGSTRASSGPAAAVSSPSSAPTEPAVAALQAPQALATVAQAPFLCTASTLAGHQGYPALMTAIRIGSHAGFDRVTVQLKSDLPYGVDLRPQAGSTFIASPRGEAVTLAGRAGLLVVVRGADGHTAYGGRRVMTASGPALREVRIIEDFEGQVQLGIGTSGSGCYRASLMSNPARLVIDIQA